MSRGKDLGSHLKATLVLGVPLVLAGTWAGRRYRPGTEAGMKRSAAAALLLGQSYRGMVH